MPEVQSFQAFMFDMFSVISGTLPAVNQYFYNYNNFF